MIHYEGLVMESPEVIQVMQIAKSVNAKKDSIVLWVLWPGHPHLSFLDVHEKSVELHTITLKIQVRGYSIITCTETSSCVGHQHCTQPWQQRR